MHTKERILLYIKKNLMQLRLTQMDYITLEGCIKSPQDIGLSQNYINEYYELISYIYDNPDKFKYQNIDTNIKNAIIIGGLTRNEIVKRSIIT